MTFFHEKPGLIKGLEKHFFIIMPLIYIFYFLTIVNDNLCLSSPSKVALIMNKYHHLIRHAGCHLAGSIYRRYFY